MRVLMFGWEFPPQISGGLGTACHGITSSLLQQNVDVYISLADDGLANVTKIKSIQEIGIDGMHVRLLRHATHHEVLREPRVEAGIDTPLEHLTLSVQVGRRQIVEHKMHLVRG